MLECFIPDLPSRPPQAAAPRKSKQIGLFARLAERLLIRMEVGSAQRPASLYLSSVDLMPMGTWLIVDDEKQVGAEHTSSDD